MKRKRRKQQASLTVMYAALVFSVQIVSIALAGAVLYVLVRTGVISGVESSTPDVTTVVLFLSLISLLLGFSLAFVTVKFPLNPLHKMVAQLNRLASGDFKARLKFNKAISSFATFREMTESFNKMAQELESTELLRSDFINNFSHEFKTPIVSIAGFAKLLKRGNLTQQQRSEYVAIIEEESLRLAYMAESMLNLTKIENQSILSDLSVFNLSEQLRASVLLLERKWAQKELSLRLEFEEFSIEANEEQLKQVWINLLDNAVKYTPQGGEITVEITEKERDYQIAVCNTGSEIAPEKQKKIFNKFYQADESHAGEGNGIGLAIVKKIVQLHGGEVSVSSANQATVFVVALPKKQIQN